MILTKAPWIFDPNGDKDRQDITSLYKAKEGKRWQTNLLFASSASDILFQDLLVKGVRTNLAFVAILLRSALFKNFHVNPDHIC